MWFVHKRENYKFEKSASPFRLPAEFYRCDRVWKENVRARNPAPDGPIIIVWWRGSLCLPFPSGNKSNRIWVECSRGHDDDTCQQRQSRKQKTIADWLLRRVFKVTYPSIWSNLPCKQDKECPGCIHAVRALKRWNKWSDASSRQTYRVRKRFGKPTS